MRILWITNLLLPEQCDFLGAVPTVNEGWVKSAAAYLVTANKDIRFAFATVSSVVERQSFEKNSATYYILPQSSTSLKNDWQWVKEDFKPDVIHIHGTEYSHGAAYIKACSNKGVVISLQGIISECAKHYHDGISVSKILNNITPNDIRGHCSILQAKKGYEKRGENEIQLLKSVCHIIGRTRWDKACVWAINPEAQYHFCNETLRPCFYSHKWEYDKCIKHSIFISQATYPLKGLHMLLQAMPLILKHFPDTRIFVAGNNVTAYETLKQKILLSGYGKILRGLIKKYKLQDHITFVGRLTEEEMCNQYLQSNVFVSCSSLENSPNSLGEAQLLGMPCVASFVGGTPDMIPNENCGMLYRFDDLTSLAFCICEVFRKTEHDYSEMRRVALNRHSQSENAERLVSIYREIAAE